MMQPAPPPQPRDVTVLICTRNRADKLGHALTSLTALRVPVGVTWEVIVVDNGSSDATPEVIGAFAGRLPLRSVVEPGRGVSRAKNAGIRVAGGRHFLLTDDDCRVAPDWLATGHRLLDSGPVQIIGGRVELFDPADLPVAVRTTPDRDVLKDFSQLIGFMHGANLAFPRALLDRVGLFDERLGPGTRVGPAEEADLMYRAFCAGIPIVYEPDLLVHHDHGRRGRDAWYAQVGSYASGAGGMAAKYLLRGDLRACKMAYWDFKSTIRLFRQDRREWRRVVAKLRMVNGALRYCFG
jgi:GT2 family glycosyltransferase